ncbi:MAG TPA: fumarylacetoacetate hydrolase family protein [Ktedonobacteraceae bacterium]|nr:fumarylacetoacetate hydrolase family protein [Ktedonobacteraceae bacterium]HEV2661942.1 fumarylacetoacetate hydrolase family protein [Ktedonobacteraceae bacterium]
MIKYQLGTGQVADKERIILYAQDTYLDLSALLSATDLQQRLTLEERAVPTSLMQMMQQWSAWQEKLPQIIEYAFAQQPQNGLQEAEITWLPPLLYPNKLICLGANYQDHNKEMGNTTRLKYPYCFFKPATTTLVGSGASVQLPELAKMIDWEVELAVVIGKRVRHVQGEEAMASIAGYSVLNDISARDWVYGPAEERSFMGLDWVMLKGFDGFAPMGPFITPSEFVPDPQKLALRLSVNGQVKQNANTATMAFTVLEIIEHLTKIMTLEPGDVIATGTPSGVGFGRKPPEFLHSGDRMVAEIEGLGSLETVMQ